MVHAGIARARLVRTRRPLDVFDDLERSIVAEVGRPRLDVSVGAAHERDTGGATYGHPDHAA